LGFLNIPLKLGKGENQSPKKEMGHKGPFLKPNPGKPNVNDPNPSTRN